MDEQLVQQVQVLADIVKAMSERLEIVFKTMDETTKVNQRSAEELQASTENINITNEALLESLSDLDSVTDDLTKTAAALLTLLPNDQQQSDQQEGS